MAGDRETGRRVHAEQTRLLAEFAALTDRKGARPTEFAADGLALQVSWTGEYGVAADGRAVALTTRLPGVLDALDAGVVVQRRADAIVEAVADLPDEGVGRCGRNALG